MIGNNSWAKAINSSSLAGRGVGGKAKRTSSTVVVEFCRNHHTIFLVSLLLACFIQLLKKINNYKVAGSKSNAGAYSLKGS